MSGHIYLLQDEHNLVTMKESTYDSESLLQELLARYPDLLAGDQIDSESPRRWLLVTREMAVPSEENGDRRWSIDHLFIDQDAIPTLVEVKRSSDSRIRREVVGQMLDYAANAVVYWPIEVIRSKFEKTCELQKLNPPEVLAAFLGDANGEDDYWQKVKTNLQAGRIRLVFVADTIPLELRRIVEFLNGQMDPAEILAVEIKQYTGEKNLKTLVPRLVGQSAVAQKKKSISSHYIEMNEQSFIKEISKFTGSEELNVVIRIIDWSKQNGLKQNYVPWEKSFSFIPVLETSEGNRFPISVRSKGFVVLQMMWLQKSAPFNDVNKRDKLCQMLNTIPLVNVNTDKMTGMPRILFESLTNEDSLTKFLKVLDWVVKEIKIAQE